jgi:hypothetical protein
MDFLMRVFIALSLATAAIAQTSSSSGSVGGGAVIVTPSGARLGATIEPTMHGQAVSGAPYSAIEVTENVQTLADGTHITQPSAKTMYYRDSQGRTRIERIFALPPGVSAGTDAGPSVIEIADPVAGVHYSLDTRDHKARKISTAPTAAIAGTVPPPPPPPYSANPQGKPQIVRQSTFVPNDQRQRPEISTESLGTKMIENVTAEGSRTTVVYPVGFMGNDRPITTVSETWTSPLQKLPFARTLCRCRLGDDPVSKGGSLPLQR